MLKMDANNSNAKKIIEESIIKVVSMKHPEGRKTTERDYDHVMTRRGGETGDAGENHVVLPVVDEEPRSLLNPALVVKVRELSFCMKKWISPLVKTVVKKLGPSAKPSAANVKKTSPHVAPSVAKRFPLATGNVANKQRLAPAVKPIVEPRRPAPIAGPRVVAKKPTPAVVPAKLYVKKQQPPTAVASAAKPTATSKGFQPRKPMPAAVVVPAVSVIVKKPLAVVAKNADVKRPLPIAVKNNTTNAIKPLPAVKKPPLPVVANKVDAKKSPLPVAAKKIDVKRPLPEVAKKIDVRRPLPVMAKKIDVKRPLPEVAKKIDVKRPLPVVAKKIDVKRPLPVVAKKVDVKKPLPVVAKKVDVKRPLPEVAKKIDVKKPLPVVAKKVDVKRPLPLMAKKVDVKMPLPVVAKKVDLKKQQAPTVVASGAKPTATPKGYQPRKPVPAVVAAPAVNVKKPLPAVAKKVDVKKPPPPLPAKKIDVKKPLPVAAKKVDAKKPPLPVAVKKTEAKRPLPVAAKKVEVKRPLPIAAKKAEVKRPLPIAAKKADVKKPVAPSKKRPLTLADGDVVHHKPLTPFDRLPAVDKNTVVGPEQSIQIVLSLSDHYPREPDDTPPESSDRLACLSLDSFFDLEKVSPPPEFYWNLSSCSNSSNDWRVDVRIDDSRAWETNDDFSATQRNVTNCYSDTNYNNEQILKDTSESECIFFDSGDENKSDSFFDLKKVSPPPESYWNLSSCSHSSNDWRVDVRIDDSRAWETNDDFSATQRNVTNCYSDSNYNNEQILEDISEPECIFFDSGDENKSETSE